MEKLKRNKIIIFLSLATIVLIIVNIFYFFKTTICTYNINQEFYSEEIKINITRLQKIKITRTYHFENEEVLNSEVEELKDDGYQIKIDNLSLVASKKEKLNDYYKDIKNYEEYGFSCK